MRRDVDLQHLTDRMLQAASARAIPCGTAVQTADQARAAADRGFRFVMVSNDASPFRQASSQLGSELRAIASAQEILGTP